MAENETIYVEPIVVDEGEIILESLIVSEEVSTTFRVGVDGVTFIPSIEEVSPEETVLSFTNNGGLDNPPSTNIKGTTGLDAYHFWLLTHEGTVTDYENWLKQPAIEAAEIANGLIDELQQLESTVEANEEIRQSNETYREETFAENLNDVNNALSDLNDLKGELNTSLDTISDYTNAANLATIAANNAADSATQVTIYANDAGDYANEQGLYAQEIAEHPTYIGTDNYVYRWNHTTQAYDKTTIYTKGEAFSVKKTYSSIVEMQSDYSSTDVKIGEFVLVVSNVEDPDNAKLYVKTNVQYDFVVDMSGAIGFTGHTPQFAIGNVVTGMAASSAAVTISENGYDDNGNPKFLLNFAIPKGDKGDTGDSGVHIGTEEPTDPLKNVWIDPNGQGIELYSDQYTTTLLKITDSNTILATGDLQGDFMSLIAGDITSIAAWVTTASTSGIVTIQIRNLTTGNDILSTKLTIDATETKSLTAAIPYVINAAYKGVSIGDIIVVDVDTAGTGTKGLSVSITISETLV